MKCKYLVDNGRCQAIRESIEGKSVRMESCLNEIKDTCCYLCNLREKCGVSCNFLEHERLLADEITLESSREHFSMRDGLIALGFFLMIIGTVIALAVPYNINSSYTWYNPITERYETITSTVTVYGHPIGWVIDGIGFLMLLVGLITHPSSSTPSTQRTFHGKVCGNCYWFGKEECKRKEKMFNAMPCEDFTP